MREMVRGQGAGAGAAVAAGLARLEAGGGCGSHRLRVLFRHF
jgi:hypothetical protein